MRMYYVYLHRARLGQTMLLSIVILTAITLVGLGFLSFITQTLRSRYRGLDVLEAQFLAQTALSWAAGQLENSPEGADWRPRPTGIPFDEFEKKQGWDKPGDLNSDGDFNDPGEGDIFVKRRAGKGVMLIKVKYLNPAVDYRNDQDNRHRGELKIVSIGRPTERSRAFRKIEAYVPIGLVNYSRWITAMKGEVPNPLIGLGIDEPIDFDGSTVLVRDELLNEAVSSLLDFEAPMRCNMSLQWQTQIPQEILDVLPLSYWFSIGRIRLIYRSNQPDACLVAGEIQHSTTDQTTTQSLVKLVEENETGTTPLGDAFPTANSLFSSFPTQVAGIAGDWHRYRDNAYPDSDSNGVPELIQAGDLRGFADAKYRVRFVEPLPPPPLDLDRYRNLTQRANPPYSLWGYYQVGGVYRGIYLDNFTDIQFKHDLNVDRDGDGKFLLKDWRLPPDAELSRTDPNSGWAFIPGLDRNFYGEPLHYVPPGAEIVFDPNLSGQSLVRITRHDWNPATGARRTFKNPDDGTEPWIQGGQPVTTFYFPYDPNGLVIFAEGNVRVKGHVYGKVTVACGGTAYIEGPLRSSSLGGQIAIFAQDCVCLNTTAMLPRLTLLTGTNLNFWHDHPTPPDSMHQQENDYHQSTTSSGPWQLRWEFDPFLFASLNPSAVHAKMWVRHSAVKLDDDDDDDTKNLKVEVEYKHDNNKEYGKFKLQGSDVPNAFTKDGENAKHMSERGNKKLYVPDDLTQVVTCEAGSPKFYDRPYRLSRWKLQFYLDRGTQKPTYAFRVLVEAVVYAARGFWYVLPIPYFDISSVGAGGPRADAQEMRRFNYFDITFRGCITEFLTAPPDEVREALNKLAYPAEFGPANIVTKWQTVKYEFDPYPSLGRTVQTGIDLSGLGYAVPAGTLYQYLSPSVPSLPVSPQTVTERTGT